MGASYRALRLFSVSIGFNLSDAAEDRIARYFELLSVWNQRLRLTGIRDAQRLVDKQGADAIAVASVIQTTGSLTDIGTGAGLPGMIVACACPGLSVTLLDSRERPISFLREVIRELGMTNVSAERMRAEDACRVLPPQQVAVSCAVRMDAFFGLARPLLATGGIAISMQTDLLDECDASQFAAANAFRLGRIFPYRVPAGDERRLVIATAI